MEGIVTPSLGAQSAQPSSGLRDESVVVVNSTEDRKSRQRADRQGRLSQFGHGSRSPWPA